MACLALLRAASVGAQAGAPLGSQGSIVGTVYDSLRTRAPLANATVVLVELSRYATTDGHGRFRIDTVPDGHYTIGFSHAVLDSLDLTAALVAIDVVGSRGTKVELFTPGAAAAYARICPGTHDIETGVVIGRARDVDDHAPLAGAGVSTEWTEFTLLGGHAAGHRVRAVARTNRDGIYLLCGVPTTVQVDVHAEVAGFSAGPTPLLLGDRLIGRLDFAISRRDSAAREVAIGDSSAGAPRAPGTASLRGSVVGKGDRPTRDAIVSVMGTLRSARTDEAGAFHLDHIPAGTRTVEVRSIGLVPMTVSMDFATGATRDTTLSFSRQAQVLKTIAVLGHGGGNANSLMVRDGFEARRKLGLGAFVTDEDISKHGFDSFTSILEGVRGVHIEYVPVKGRASIPVPYLLGAGMQAHCLPNFFLDGAPYRIGDANDVSDLSSMLPPVWIKGIEVYSNPGAMPPQYDMTALTGCGSIVLWTR
jgi:hypothetical protein